MLVYDGHPLYGFLPDTIVGSTKGQGSKAFGSPWWVLNGSSGAEITSTP